MPDFQIYLTQEVLVLIPALWFISYLLKSTPFVYDWLIPWITLLLGVAGVIALLGISAENVIQGVIVAAVTITGNHLAKETVSGLKKE